MVEIQINPSIEYSPSLEVINALSKAAFKRLVLHFNRDSYGIHFTDDEEIQTLNSQYRGFDKPTDVLSFEADVFDPEEEVTYLGDIVISVETMKRQAAAAEHPVETEMLLLITHGLLHLVGFDHANEEEKEEMWTLQEEILAMIGVSPKKLPED